MAEPKLCNYCGIVIDSGMVCATDAEFNHCPSQTFLDWRPCRDVDGATCADQDECAAGCIRRNPRGVAVDVGGNGGR